VSYFLHLLILGQIYLLAVLGTQLLVQDGRLFFLAAGALFGAGAYAVALGAGLWGSVPALIAAGAAGAIVGALLCAAAGRVRAESFALLTLGVQVVWGNAANNLTAVTGGPFGIPGIPAFSWLGWTAGGLGRFALVSLVVVGAGALAVVSRRRGPWGKAARAAALDRRAFESLGKDPRTADLELGALAGGAVGVSGGLFAFYLGYVDAATGGLDRAFTLFAMAVLGTAWKRSAAWFGVAILLLVPEVLRFVRLSGPAGPAIQQLILGCVLLLIALRGRRVATR